MTRYELKRELITAVAELYQIRRILEYAIRAGVPLDTKHMVQLDTTAKRLCGVLAKLNRVEPDTS